MIFKVDQEKVGAKHDFKVEITFKACCYIMSETDPGMRRLTLTILGTYDYVH